MLQFGSSPRGATVPGEVSPENDVACVIKFANLGNEPAHKVVVALYLGSGLAITHSDPQPTGTGASTALLGGVLGSGLAIAHSEPQPTGTRASNTFPGGVAQWDVGNLGVGMSRTVRSVIHATSIPDDGALVTATITAGGLNIDSTNNSASLLLHKSPPTILKSARALGAAGKPVGVSEKATLYPASYRWRYFFGLILVIIAVLIFFRFRR